MWFMGRVPMLNGARNILAAGRAVLACGGVVQSGRPVNWEPGTARALSPSNGIPSPVTRSAKVGRMSRWSYGPLMHEQRGEIHQAA